MTAFRLLLSNHSQAGEDDHEEGGEDNSVATEDDRSKSLLGGERERDSGKSSSKRPQRLDFGLSEIAALGKAAGGGYTSLTEESKETMATVEENTAVDTTPPSPPELSYSKSSKSSDSSYRSDSLSDAGSREKLSHFEDVTLEDVADSVNTLDDCNVKAESRPTLRRPVRQSTNPSSETNKRLPPLPRENRFPSLRGAVNGVLQDQSLNLPNGRGIRRGYTSPLSPSMMSSPQRIPSRSPSPSGHSNLNGHSVSPKTVASVTPRSSIGSMTPNPNGPYVRRQSWQPHRKTVKELEAEYNDEDEEVPDEAILENVPITPMPGQQLQIKPPSPHRRPSLPSPALHSGMHSANVPKNAKRPSAPTMMPNGQYGSPRSPRHPRPQMIPHSATVTSFPTEQLSLKHRSKSWNAHLNDEARELSVALEEYSHRLSTDKRSSGPNSAANSPPRPSLSKTRAKTTITMELPPVQKGNIMIDPLPVSKEKEKVLSRTRPSWLPPKCQKEEKKHMKQWEQMMARAASAERKRELKVQEDAETKDERDEGLARTWEEQVLPNWDKVIKEPHTRELWWRGIAPSARGEVWRRALGNDLQLSAASYEAAFQRANDTETRFTALTPEERAKCPEAAWFAAIARDVPSVYPEVEVFTKGSPLHSVLTDVLRAYTMYRHDVGYVFGTHLVAGILCLHMRAPDAFVALANMLNKPLPLAFLINDPTAMGRAYEMVLSTLLYKIPKLHAHLTAPATDLRPEDYLDPMFRCLFAYNLPPEHVSRVFDVWVFEGDKALVRAAVAALGGLEGKLYGTRDEVLDLISWKAEGRWDFGSEDDFIAGMREAGKVEET